MLTLFERFCPFALSYLLGFSLLGFGWACRRERLSVEQIASRVVIFAACLLVAALLAFLWLARVT